jgi:hypothetical protein
MRQKLHAPPEVQLLVNTIMDWAQGQLKNTALLSAAAAWLLRDSTEPRFHVAEPTQGVSLAEQETALLRVLQPMWERDELAVFLLAAPVLYGRRSAERSEAIRLHVEAASGYCADIFMPYRIRAASRWRHTSQNRVHFSHPVAQESDSRFGGSPVRA